MKVLLIAFILAFSTVLLAKRDVDFDSFNKEMMENIQEVIDENPQMYETRPVGRKPASVEPVDEEENITEKLDEVNEQADGVGTW